MVCGTPDLSVIIPAHNEAACLGACLGTLMTSVLGGLEAEVIVVANGCDDDTAAIARAFGDEARASGWQMRLIERAQGGKPGALQAGDDAAHGPTRIYLDADVMVTPGLIAALWRALDTPEPRYASGTPQLARAGSWISQAYGRFWRSLPFVATGVPGFGVFATNAAGRARWQTWPDIISDDTFARLQFAPQERIRVAEGYRWPLVEGFANLVRVRRRQNRGVAEVLQRFPHLAVHDDVPPPGFPGLLKRAILRPVGFGAYALVALAVKTPLFHSTSPWARGR